MCILWIPRDMIGFGSNVQLSSPHLGTASTDRLTRLKVAVGFLVISPCASRSLLLRLAYTSSEQVRP